MRHLIWMRKNIGSFIGFILLCAAIGEFTSNGFWIGILTVIICIIVWYLVNIILNLIYNPLILSAMMKEAENNKPERSFRPERIPFAGNEYETKE